MDANYRETYNVNFGKFPFEQRSLKLSDGPHNVVVLRHNGFQASSSGPQFMSISVPQQFFCSRWEVDIKWLPTQIVDLLQQKQELRV